MRVVRHSKVAIKYEQLLTLYQASLSICCKKEGLFMRIAIISLGSRGDVQPYIALGKGLQKAGHIVRLASHENFESLISSHGLEFFPMTGNVQEFMATPKMRELTEKGDFLAINAEATLLQAYIFPFTPTKAFPAILFPKSLAKLGSYINWFSHVLFRQIMWQGTRQGDELARKQVLELPAAPFLGAYNSPHLQRFPVLYGFSPSIINPPSDWQNTHVTGYWFLDEDPNWTPSKDLMDFLLEGSPPVFIGFGSMGNRNPEATADLVLKAIAIAGQRAILQSGWGGLSKRDLPDTVFIVDSIPHAFIFPYVAAVVHHGGAGTTSAALRAGVPSIVIPFFGDQPFWGNLIAELGVGTKPIPRKKLTAEHLAKAIQMAVTDRSMCETAANLGEKIRAENGIAKAVAIVNQIEY